MRFDNKIKPELNLTTRQRLFGEVWFNLVHEYSLDAFRVRTMNPVNVINELVRSFTVQPFNDRDRAKIIAEAVELISTSRIIRQGALGEIAEELILVLEQWGKKSNRNDGAENKADADSKGSGAASHAMILAFGRELESALNEAFLRTCIDWLTAQLTDAAPLAQDDQTESIVQITGQLLSHLINVGWSFKSLFHLYRRAFAPDSQHTAEGEAYDFARALRWLFARVARAPKNYVITFTINQVATGAELPNRVGDIVFSSDAPPISASSSALVKRMAQVAAGRIFATMTVEANDSRIAGMRAAEHIEQVLDVLRYDFIKQNFSLSDRFLVQKATHHVALEIAKTVPNEKREVTPAQFQTFMDQLRNLVASGTLEADSKDRIYAAFRLYRTGAETANLENKLVQWWTALEYLVKASGGGIGDAVERALYPTVVLAYLPKHLNSLRLALLEFNAPLMLSDGTQPDLVTCRLPELLKYCKDQEFKRSAMAAAQSNSPYAEHYFASLFKKVESPKSELEALERHEKAVRWQIQRIYRARCDIVHSAGRVAQVALLCANLESYLKILLDTFLISLQKIDTLRTPREFFDRQQHVQDRIKAQLGAKPVASEALLLAALSKHQ